MPDNIKTPTRPHEATRRQIARFLPDALAKALTSYREFMDVDIPKNKPREEEEEGQTNAAAFERHHKACKAAIAHIELLIKLAEWAHLPDAQAADHNHQIMLSGLIKEASEEIKDMKGENDNEQDGDGD